MKKFLSAILVCVLLVGTMLTLVSCGNSLFGTYEGEGLIAFDLKFSGSKVSILVDGEKVLTGTYDIDEDDGKKTISFDFVDEDEATDDEKKFLKIIDAILDEDLSFEKDGKTIKIAKILKFTKK